MAVASAGARSEKDKRMVCLCLVSLVLGTGVAAGSRQPAFEIVSGALIVCGLSLLGLGLPLFR